MKKYRILYFTLLICLLFAACEADSNTPTFSPSAGDTGTSAEATINPEDMFSDRDSDTGYRKEVAYISLNGTTASCDSNAVVIDGSTVTITDEGTYVISGTLTDGQIIVNTEKDKKTQLVLNSASIHSQTSAPIYILQSDKVFLTLAEGTENSLSNGGSFAAIDDNNIDSVIFSKEDLTLNGSGSLTISSPAGHGIVGKDDVVFTGGSYTITTASHGITGKDSVRISDGSFIISAGKDGIQSDNDDDESLGFVYIRGGTFDVVSEGDGISASGSMQIDSGTFSLLTGGGSKNGSKPTSGNWGGMGGGRGPGGPGGGGGWGGMGGNTTSANEDSTSIKGLKSGGAMVLNGGSFTIDSADDAVHSNSDLTVCGGSFTIATGDDGFHADETLTVTNGTIQIFTSYEGLEGLHVTVSGGDIQLVASDDGINAAGGTDSSGMGGFRPGGDRFGGGNSNGSIEISGGSIYIEASGDGIDANGSLLISGGYTVVTGPNQGDTATLDYDTSATITGGTFIGTGAMGMAQTFSDNQQGVIAVSVGSRAAGSVLRLEDKDGTELIRFTPPLPYSVVIFSSPDIQSGESYVFYADSDSATFAAS